jgi:hypothetical protein
MASIKSVKSRKSGVFPPGFDLNEFSSYVRSKEPVSFFFVLAVVRLFMHYVL